MKTLIGPAATIHRTLSAKLTRANPREDVLKFLIYGPPGSGKSTVAAMLAAQLLTGTVPSLDAIGKMRRSGDWACAIEEMSGASVSVDTVRQWHNSRGMFSMFGDWRIRIVEELDSVPSVAQTAMLDYLDKVPPGTAIIATSNIQMDLLQERFHSRFQAWKCPGPEAPELRAHLTGHFPELPPSIATTIAECACGNVRQALLDAESWLDTQLAAA